MTLAIERLGDEAPVNGKLVIFGPHGVGKTSLVRALPEDRTCLLDLEAGKLALGARTEKHVIDGEEKTVRLPAWKGLRVDVFSEAQRLQRSVWDMARDIAVWLGGPSPFVTRDDEAYSALHYETACKRLGDPAPFLENVDNIFVDSISVASRACFQWGKGQARGQIEKGEKRGQVDTRGLYGLVKDESLHWLTQLQHIPKNIFLVGGLDQVEDDNGRKTWKPQVEGSGTAQALPGILDEVITYTNVTFADGSSTRAFVTHTLNPWGFPAKDRSGALEMVEEPDLAKLMSKLASAGAA